MPKSEKIFIVKITPKEAVTRVQVMAQDEKEARDLIEQYDDSEHFEIIDIKETKL